MNDLAQSLRKATQAYTDALGHKNDYLDHYEWVFESDDDQLFEAYAQLEANKSEQLGIPALRESMRDIENQLMEAIELAVNTEGSQFELSELQPLLAQAKKSVTIKNRILQNVVELYCGRLIA